MCAIYFLFFLSFNLFAQSKPSIQVMPNPQSIEDFEHQFKGCPENSECDQVMGMQMQRWKDLVKKLKDGDMTDGKKAQYLELFRAKYGIPAEFYTNKKSQQGFKPLYFNSPCKHHNPKEEDQKVLKGMAFLKSISKDKAVVWRDQTQIEVPTDTLLIPQPVKVYGTPDQLYYLPLSDQPLFIKNKELYVLKEDDDLFYILKVSSSGEWKIDYVDFTKLSEWEEKRQNVPCPADKVFKAHSQFGESFCKTVWDEDLKKTVIVKMHQGCSI